MDDVSGQNVHEEDGQADVEQDDHADHDGVGTLEKTSVAAQRHGSKHSEPAPAAEHSPFLSLAVIHISP